MRVILLTALTMVAFAANSLLTRVAVDSGSIGAGHFAVVRVAAGAAMLVALAGFGHRKLVFASGLRLVGAGALTLYMVGFSLAYRALDAGLGALLIFGVVQLAIFAIAALQGLPPTGRQLAGSVVALAGLTWVLWPTDRGAVDPGGAAAMVLAGIGWAAYTLAGRREVDALAGTAANFCLALPLTALAVWGAGLASPDGGGMSAAGIGWAVLAGAVTSGLGYALWYSVLPSMAPAVAAIVMLSVPVIALAGGVLLLGEVATPQLLTGAVLVIGGIAWAVRPARRTGPV